LKTATTGQLLVERGTCTPELLEKAAKAAKAAGTTLCSQLLAMGACDERTLASVLAEKHGLPGIDLSRTIIPLDVLSRVPRQVAEADLILPLSEEGGRIHLAVSTIDRRVIGEIRFVSGLEVSAYVAVLGSLRRAIAEAYDALARGENAWRGASAFAGLAFLALVLPGDPGAEELEVGRGDFEMLPEGDEPAQGEIEIAVDAVEGEVVAEVRMDGASPHPGVKRVLVVDDEPEIRKLVARAFEAKGFLVDVAADGEEALAKISATLPDLVMLDAMLPRVHGFEVCLKVRSDPRTRHVPVIIMTAVYRGWRFAQDARESYGAEDYIEKPFHIDDLLRRAGVVLESTASRALLGAASADRPLRRGKELLLAGQLQEAASAFEEAIRVDPFSAEAHYHLARVLKARGDHFRAMTAFEQAVELRDNFFVALRSLAALYTGKGFRRKASETMERALAAAPDEPTREAIKKDLLKLL
jgi:DNA-binding response OmpR family regulator